MGLVLISILRRAAASARLDQSAISQQGAIHSNRSRGSLSIHVIKHSGSYAEPFAMHRRDFIACLGGFASAWPVVALAQKSGMRQIGALMPVAVEDSNGRDRVIVFGQALLRAGYHARSKRREKSQIERAMRGRVLASVELIGTYQASAKWHGAVKHDQR
jgi:hypothetical protein